VSRRNCILNLPGFTIQKTYGYNPLIIEAHYRRKARCPGCNTTKLRKKASFLREVRHESIGLRQTVLRFKAFKFYCGVCSRYFNQSFPGILKYQRATERLRHQIFQSHTQGISQKELSLQFKLGKATIERWYHQGYLKLNAHIKLRHCPKVLGIDEHRFSKKNTFVTTLCDLRHHKVFDVVKGKANKDLAEYFKNLPGKENVKVVCMDLSSSYKAIVKRYFPKAMIVADRFHVIRLLNQSALETYPIFDPNIKYERGLLALLRTRPDRLSALKMARLRDYLNANPAIAAIYHFKQKLHRLLMYKHRTAHYCRRLLPLFLARIQQLKLSGFEPLQTLAKTLYRWREEIVRMWRFVKSNGITEGFHRKMKLIQRRAYGFRNFENYRLRVRVLCG
jgi:transposase